MPWWEIDDIGCRAVVECAAGFLMLEVGHRELQQSGLPLARWRHSRLAGGRPDDIPNEMPWFGPGSDKCEMLALSLERCKIDVSDAYILTSNVCLAAGALGL